MESGRNPLSDCTNSSINKPTLSSSSSAFNKSSVTKCSNSRSSLPPFKTPPPPSTVDLRDVSELISVCSSRLRTSYERKKNKRKAVANPVVASSKPLPKFSNIREKSDGVEDLDLSEAKQSCGKKQHAVYKHKSKGAQLQEFIEKQIAYFKEVDEFKLSEEEVGSIDELE